MKVNLPKDWSEVSVAQYQALQSVLEDTEVYQKNLSVISVMSGWKVDDLEKLSLKSYTKLMTALDFLNYPIENRLTRKFKLNGSAYKLFTDLYEINGGQYMTLMHLLKNDEDTINNLHQIMAVFCVPYKKKFLWFGKYKYDGGEHQEVAKEMLDLPITIAYPLSAFFLPNSEKYDSSILESSVIQAKKLQRMGKEYQLSKADTVG